MKPKTIATAIILAVFTFAALCYLTGCAITGTLETPYGSITGDGKTTNVSIKLPTGYSK